MIWRIVQFLYRTSSIKVPADHMPGRRVPAWRQYSAKYAMMTMMTMTMCVVWCVCVTELYKKLRRSLALILTLMSFNSLMTMKMMKTSMMT